MPALEAEAIWRGVQAPASACFFTWSSVIPKQLQTYTRFTSRGQADKWRPSRLIGEANLTLPAPPAAQKPGIRTWGADHMDPRPTAAQPGNTQVR
ncbi:hypothetical protein GCM10012286_77400 [Streptomyces lasiicapitis]|uniref:Uncharacterized protein n=1 Tax=Streptomyces lasiicapitis TaxID=1923961 RepID=A0ABQ2MVV4_9ACTN|nr:hypothetical protein GCM10012286_77400 [Streptomyces lasiicapitis]